MTRQRILLIVLLAWALVMIVPDVLRVVQPLGSFGFYADNDGMIYDVIGPFDEELPISGLECRHTRRRQARAQQASLLSLRPHHLRQRADGAWAEHQFVLKGQQATFDLKATGDRPARQITLIAAQVPANPFERFIVLIDQIAGIWWWSPRHGSCGRDRDA